MPVHRSVSSNSEYGLKNEFSCPLSRLFLKENSDSCLRSRQHIGAVSEARTLPAVSVRRCPRLTSGTKQKPLNLWHRDDLMYWRGCYPHSTIKVKIACTSIFTRQQLVSVMAIFRQCTGFSSTLRCSNQRANCFVFSMKTPLRGYSAHIMPGFKAL